MSHSRIWRRQKLEKCLSTWFTWSCCLWNPEAMWRRLGWSARCWTCVAHMSLPKFYSCPEASGSWVSQPVNFPCMCVCMTLCGPVVCSPAGSSVHGILQARILEWVAMPFSRGSSPPRDQTRASCVAGRFFTIWATMEAPNFLFLGFISWTQAEESGRMLVTFLLGMYRQMVSIESLHVPDHLLTHVVVWNELWPPNPAIHSSTPLTPPSNPNEDLSLVDYSSGH